MIPILFRLFLTISSLALTGAVFAVNKGIVLNPLHSALKDCPPICSYLVYFLIVLGLVALSLGTAKFLGEDSISQKSIISVEFANDAYLPSYLGYFFVALGIQDYVVFIYVFSIICLFVFCSRAAYFNPLFFVFGFQFYNLESKSGCKSLIITRKSLKNPDAVYFDKIKRINDLTYIDLE